MNREALKDSKVRFDLGEGWAPEEDEKRLNFLKDEHREGQWPWRAWATTASRCLILSHP